MKQIRNSAKAIIIKNGRLLATHNIDEYGDWYLLPGGGQQPGETLVETLQRECHEEIGATVRIGNLRLVREYIGKNHEFAETESDVHQVEFMFECEVDDEYEPRNGAHIDKFQVGVVWLALSELENYTFYPSRMKACLQAEETLHPLSYLGDVN